MALLFTFQDFREKKNLKVRIQIYLHLIMKSNIKLLLNFTYDYTIQAVEII